MDDKRRDELERVAIEVRKDVIRMVGVARARGLASALSIVDLLVYLYWAHMNVYPNERSHPERDRLVLSGGTPASLYACLARLGFFGRDELWSYRRLGAMLQGYPDVRTPGIEAPGGICGGGVGIASGISLALRLDGNAARVFCIVGYEELRSGTFWESVYSAASNRLGNLVLLVDKTNSAGMGHISPMWRRARFDERLESFGWFVCEADGHDFVSIDDAMTSLDYRNERPKAVLVQTHVDKALFQQGGEAEGDSHPLSNDDIDNALFLLEQETKNRRALS